jgi:hypothetical protein
VRRNRSSMLSWVEMYREAKWAGHLRAGSPSLLPATGLPNLPRALLKSPLTHELVSTRKRSQYQTEWNPGNVSDITLRWLPAT